MNPFDPPPHDRTQLATDPHRGVAVELTGAPPATAEVAVVLLHGRGASARDITALAHELALPAATSQEVAFLAPQADGHTWYPNRFLAPIADNQPWLGSAHRLVERIVDDLAASGLDSQRIVLLGFSQGACLALDAGARLARRWGGLVGLTGGLIGPPGSRFELSPALAGTPVFLGCGDHDPHIPLQRVEETALAFRAAGAVVTKRIYPGLPHTVVADELAWVRQLLISLVDEATGSA